MCIRDRLNTKVGEGEYTMERLREEYDAVYIAIGAHTDKKVGIEGEDAKNVLSAVEFLGNIGDDEIPDFTGKKVCIIGGGNVAMDCTRSAIRLSLIHILGKGLSLRISLTASAYRSWPTRAT